MINVWRCSKRGINPHDIKIDIRYKNILENMKKDLRLLYFIIKSINQININC